MTRWGDKVRKALQDPRVLQGISVAAASWMTEHIDENRGRGPGGGFVKHKPLSGLGFRAGGQPLRDTGSLYRSLSAQATSQGTRIAITMRGNKYGLYQDRGFTTKGPNFIPLTMKGRRNHATGRNPNIEGLKRGKDYLMAWRGVTVPSRPFIMPTREDLKSFGTSIYLGLKAVLRGT